MMSQNAVAGVATMGVKSSYHKKWNHIKNKDKWSIKVIIAET